MRLAISRDGVSLGSSKILETPRKYEEGRDLFIQTAKMLSGGEPIKAIAGGIAGPFSKEKCSLVTSPNLGGWIGRPLCDDLESELGASVYVENDSAVVALGEAVYGAGKGHKIVAYITVSTGVGGARIVDGQIDQKAIGFEPGFQVIDADKTMCPECDDIYLGDFISGKAAEKRFGKKPYEITDPLVWDKFARWLAYGLNNVAVFWSPDVIVLGGSMITKKIGIPFDRTEFYFNETLKIFPIKPKLKKAELEDEGGLHGALALLNQRFKEN